jgi:hypothetical protein
MRGGRPTCCERARVTSRSRTSRSRRAAVAVGLILAALAAGFAAPGWTQTDPAEEPGEAGDARQRLLEQRAAVASRLVEAESSLTAANQAVAATEEALGEQRAIRAQVDLDVGVTVLAREEPLAIRRAVAVQVYMAGDPAANSMLEELVDGSSGIDGVRERALYTSVVEWASDTLERLDAQLERLRSELAALDEEIPELESLLDDQRAAAAAELTARDALVAQVADFDDQLRRLNRAILTGLPVERVETRPILVVKIDNVSGARPQVGLAAADIVIEEKVEAGLSRLAALYQSTGADPVGPVRSARTSDIHLLANLGSPLFAYSGANLGVGGALASSPLVDVGATRHSGLYYRESSRRAPHNLYSRTSRLWTAEPGGSPPQALFEFRGDGEGLASGARPVAGVDVTYGATRGSFSWAPGAGVWLRETDGRPHMVAGGGQVAPQNVVVRFVDYRPSPADARSPEAVVTGSGELWVLTNGHVIEGRWEQATPTSPTRWLDADDNPIRLTPGRTWILLPSPGDGSLR